MFVPIKDLIKNEANEAIENEGSQSCQARSNSISASRQINLRQGRPRTERSSGDHGPTLEDQDAKPGEESDQVDGNRDSFQQQLMNHGWPS